MHENPEKRKRSNGQDKPGAGAIKGKRKKTPRRINPDYLHNAGLHYLGRFASGAENFRRVMLRKVRRSCMAHPDQDYETCRAMVDALVEKFEKSGLLNDESYARGSVSSLRRRGFSARAIALRLAAKGLSRDAVQEALGAIDAEKDQAGHDPEIIAALLHARKKKLGPFGEIDKGKAMAILARRGFSYETIRLVLEMKKAEAVESLGSARQG